MLAETLNGEDGRRRKWNGRHGAGGAFQRLQGIESFDVIRVLDKH